MGKVETGGDWAYLDQLDGVTLEEGEPVEVQFPDGTILYTTVVTESYVQKEMEQGGYADISYKEAYVEMEYRGLTIRIPLNDDQLEVKRR